MQYLKSKQSYFIMPVLRIHYYFILLLFFAYARCSSVFGSFFLINTFSKMFPSIISRNTKTSRRMDENSSLNIPPPTCRFTIFKQRHSKDLNYRIDTYDPDEPTPSIRYDDAQLDMRSSPSYSKFKAP